MAKKNSKATALVVRKLMALVIELMDGTVELKEFDFSTESVETIPDEAYKVKHKIVGENYIIKVKFKGE